MAPGGGRGGGGGGGKDEVVQMGGQTLKRVMDDTTKQWVYRPVDVASGQVISKEAFEAQKREERRVRAENDPRKQAEREKQWAAQQRAEIRNMRVEESQKMKRDEHHRKLQSGLVERRRPRRRQIVNVPEPKLLLVRDVTGTTLVHCMHSLPSTHSSIHPSVRSFMRSVHTLTLESRRRRRLR